MRLGFARLGPQSRQQRFLGPKDDLTDREVDESFLANLALPGLLEARLVRSPLPHARVKRVETSRALQVRGVVAVLTGAELVAGLTN